jgi:hypothetical protein
MARAPKDQEIVLEVASTSAAADELQKLALEQGAKIISPTAEKPQAALESTKSIQANLERQEIVLEIPEESAQKLESAVKHLPERLKATKDLDRNQITQQNLGGAVGGGGLGGAGSGEPGAHSPISGAAGKGASTGTLPAADSRFAAKMQALPKMKRIRIVLVRKSPPE